MKIIIVLQSYNGGGAEKIALTLAREWTEEGHDVTLAVLFPRGPYRNAVPSDLPVYEMGIKRERSALFGLRKIFKDRSPDVVLSAFRATHIWLALALILSRKPLVIFREANIFFPRKTKSLKGLFTKYFLSLAYRRANKIIANSNDTKTSLKEILPFVERKIDVIPNPIDFDALAVESNITHDYTWIESSAEKVIVSMGRLHPQKNFSLLIRAFAIASASNPQLHLVIIGDGELRSDLEDLTVTLSVQEKVTFTGFIDEPARILTCCNLYVQTSVYEGFGNALVEAIGCGVPVMAMDCTGAPKEIIEDNTIGHLFPGCTPEELAELMAQFFLGELRIDPAPLDYMKSKYSAKKIAKRYIDAFPKC